MNKTCTEMTKQNKPGRPMRMLGVLVIIAAMIAGAWYWLNKPLKWTEEVQLASGQVIVVKRTASAQSLGEIGGPGGWEAEGMTLEIIKPQLPDKLPVWDFPYVPIVLDRDPQTHEWFVVATFYSCKRWYALGKPHLPYLEFRVRNNNWKQIDFSKTHFERKANVLTAIRSSGEPDHTLQSKEEIMNDRRIARSYRYIVNAPSGC